MTTELIHLVLLINTSATLIILGVFMLWVIVLQPKILRKVKHFERKMNQAEQMFQGMFSGKKK